MSKSRKVPPRKTLHTCNKGHQYHKSSDCPVCPKCEELRKPEEGFLAELVAPARRALENKGIISLIVLSQHTEQEILALHGIGKTTLPKLTTALRTAGLQSKKSLKPAVKKSAAKPFVHYHKDGSVWAKGQMAGDHMHGYWEWFRKDGIIMRSGSFNNGKQVGEWITYDKQGKVFKVTKMKSK